MSSSHHHFKSRSVMMKNLAVWRFGRVQTHILDQPTMVDPRIWVDLYYHCDHHHHHRRRHHRCSHHLGSWSGRRGHSVSKSVTRLLKKLLGSFKKRLSQFITTFLFLGNRLHGTFTWIMKRNLWYASKGGMNIHENTKQYLLQLTMNILWKVCMKRYLEYAICMKIYLGFAWKHTLSMHEKVLSPLSIWSGVQLKVFTYNS